MGWGGGGGWRVCFRGVRPREGISIFVLLLLMLMSQFSLMRTGAT